MIRLGVVGVPGMHGMTHFMGDCGNGIQSTREVHHDVRSGIIGAAGISAAGFAGVGIDIDPSFFKRLSDGIAVILAKRADRLENKLLCLIIRVLFGDIPCQRRVDIIVVQFIDTENFLSQLHISVHGVHMLVNGCDQIVIDSQRNVVIGQAHCAA